MTDVLIAPTRGPAMRFETFVDDRLPAMIALARALCGQPAAAEDVVQETLLRAHQRWDRISAMESPYGYVRTMIVNEHLSWRRRSARQLPVADVDLGSRPDHAQRVTDRADLLQRLERLPDRQRTAVVLRYFADLDDAEIAEALGCAPVSVRSYLSRGLAALRVDVRATEEA